MLIEEISPSEEEDAQFYCSRAPVDPLAVHKLFSDAEASASAILEFIQLSYFPLNRDVWDSIKKSLQKLTYCSTRSIDLLKYEAANEADRQTLKLWLEKAEKMVYAAEDVLIDFESVLGGDEVAARGSSLVGQKRKISDVTGSEISSPLTVEQLSSFSYKLEQVCSSFNALLTDHAQSFTFLRAVGQRVPEHNFPKVTEQRAPIGREIEWKRLTALLLQSTGGCSSTVVAEAPETTKGKAALGQSPSQRSSEHNVTVISIIGPNGVGKTVLVHNVYNNCVVSEAFDVRLWVCMSEKTNEISLLKEIIKGITRQPCGIFEHSMLQEILKDELTGKKFLLVLDGAENENEGFLSSVLAFLEIGAKGSFILVVTSSRELGIAIDSKNVIYLDPLSMKISWLISLQLFARPIIGFGLRKMCKKLVARCGGIPLCIKMLCGALYCSDNEAWFEAVMHNNLWEIDKLDGAVLPALRVCLDILPIHLKPCLKYCSLFPKNFIFDKKHIVLLWISQGFIEPGVGTEVEEVGSHYFDELSGRSFFENSPFHNINEYKFVMHGLIHFLVQQVSREECFRSDDCLVSASATVKHVSIADGEFKTNDITVVTKGLSDLHTLYVVNDSTSEWNDTFCPMSHLQPLHDLLVKFKNLRTLNLSGTNLEELPVSIQFLENLCYMGLNATKIKALPSEINKLINLQTLEAKQCPYLVELPKSITGLSNLRHLDVRKISGFVGMPCGMGHLTNLKTLSILNVGEVISQCSIGEMKNLENLRGSLQISGLENIGSFNDAKEASLVTKKFLQSVTLHWNPDKRHLKFNEAVSFDVFGGLIPNNNLEELIIRNYPGIAFPTWVEDSKFSKLSSIVIDNCFKSIQFPFLGLLPSLRYLSVKNMYGIRKLGMIKKSCWKILPSFPSLEMLNLREMHGLEELFEIEEGDFPHLHTLSISRCLMLKSIPCFPSLLELSIHSCTSIPKLSGLPSLKFLKIEGVRKIASINLPHSLIGLKKLEISNCNELVSVVDLRWLASLKDIKVIQCPKLVIDGRQKRQLNKKETTRPDNEGQTVSSAGESLDESMSSSMIDINTRTASVEEYSNAMLGRASKMAAKRRDDEDPYLLGDRRMNRLPSFSTVIREAIMVKSVSNLFMAIEPLPRRVVQEEIERGLINSPRIIERAPTMRIEAPTPSMYQLIFKTPPSIPIFTGCNIEDFEGKPLQIRLVGDANASPSYLPSPIKLELVVLDGDFPMDGTDDWSSEEFNKYVVKERAGKRPLLTGEVSNITMRDGEVSVGDLQFTDNSSWIRSRNFRIAVRVVPGSYEGPRIREAITDKFVVRDNRGELYRKHYPPFLHDEVWRLEKIGKDGIFHRKLQENKVTNVEEFLRLLNVDQNHLRTILGSGMSDKMWEITVNHAKTCYAGEKVYLHGAQNVTVYLNSLCQILAVTIDGIPKSLQELPRNHKNSVHQLVQDAYRRWGSLREADGVPDACIARIGSETVIQGPAEPLLPWYPTEEDFKVGDSDDEGAVDNGLVV